MRKYARLFCGVVLLAAVCGSVSCGGASLSVGPGGAALTFTIAGETFVIAFGQVGELQTLANQTVRQEGAVSPFADRPGERPNDVPAVAEMRLLSNTVTVTPLDATAERRAQGNPINGSATVRFLVDEGSSTTPCTTGIFLAEYELTVVNNDVTVENEVFELSDAARDLVLSNDITMCVEVTADFDGHLDMEGFQLDFSEETVGDDGPTGETTTAFFTFRNDDFENIHILLPGDDFSAENRITPGQTRTATINDAAIGLGVFIQAGRNGQVLNSTDCPTVTGENYFATVVWDGSSLTCEAEQSGGQTRQVPIDSNGDAAAVTNTVNGVDYAQIGVLYDYSPDSPPPPGPSSLTVDLAALGLQTVETVYVATQTAWSFDLGNGVRVATFICEYTDGGSPTTLDLVMGQNTAEWAWENPSHAAVFGGPPPHSMPTIVFTNATDIDSDLGTYDGHTYAAQLTLDSSRTLASMSLELVDADTLVSRRAPENSEPTWLGQAHIAVTLEGPSGTPNDQDDAPSSDLTAADLHGCWRVDVVDAEEDEPVVLIYDIDASGNLATLWVEDEAGDPPRTQIIEVARFSSANAGFLGSLIANTQQSITVDADAMEAELSFSFDFQFEDQSTTMALDIHEAALSGDPPSSFVSNSVSGSADTTWAPPANGQATGCPDPAQEDVVSQEEVEADLDLDLDACGTGTGMMMPLMFFSLWFIRPRRRVRIGTPG